MPANPVRTLIVSLPSPTIKHHKNEKNIILYKNMAAKLGISLRRTESLNTSPLFIKALADLVIEV